MKKILFVALALIALAVFAAPAQAQSPDVIGKAYEENFGSWRITCPVTITIRYGSFIVSNQTVLHTFREGIFTNLNDGIGKEYQDIATNALRAADENFLRTTNVVALDPPWPFLDQVPTSSDLAHFAYPDVSFRNDERFSVEGRVLFAKLITRWANLVPVKRVCSEFGADFVIEPRAALTTVIASWEYRRGQQWHTVMTYNQLTKTTYLTATSGKTFVELPIRDVEMQSLLAGEFDPNIEANRIKFEDPAASVGALDYQNTVIAYAAQIKNSGLLVGRFEWQTIQDEETVNDLLVRFMLLKAWKNGGTFSHHYAAYFRDRATTVTSVNVNHNQGLFGLSNTTTSTNSTTTADPVVRGDLYLESR